MTALLSRKKTDKLMEMLRERIAENLGVTLVQDFNGAWGPAGQIHLTMRFRDGDDLIEVSTVITSISSAIADDEQKRLDREDK